jgi:Skp family chaperone for outer membrane proteins
LQGKNPQEEAAQAEFREFQGRVQAYQRLRQQRQAEFTAFVAKQYVEAYELARASSAAVAESLGFQYVLAARGKDKPITTDNPERLIEALLGRPVLLAPENADITADVRKDLKLE